MKYITCSSPISEEDEEVPLVEEELATIVIGGRLSHSPQLSL